MKRARHVAYTGKKRNAYKVLMEKCGEKAPLGRAGFS
jgi:hypothetical protein